MLRVMRERCTYGVIHEREGGHTWTYISSTYRFDVSMDQVAGVKGVCSLQHLIRYLQYGLQ